ncbi:CrcB family protein [Jatrophihabitans sp.]|uniref:fluoride efflux transporter FluC n=1 Tax=Jatrophihabitans sp. TaxID=1932789 RepID=UPI0030C6C02E|nr:CrcB-like protein [Jatrophihabitans sp.]
MTAGPVDPDVGPGTPRPEWDLLAVIALGGVAGAEARYGVSRLVTHGAGAMPWSTVLINLVGALLIGVLMGAIDTRGAHRLVRPFIGVGVLGGFTTFSTFAVDLDVLLHAGRIGVAIGYLAVTAVGCVLAVTASYRLTRRCLGAAA